MTEIMQKGKFGQGKCPECSSFHWAIQLDEANNPIEFKCCRCGRIIKYDSKKIQMSIKSKGRLSDEAV